MASVGTLPGTLNIAVKAGDELSQLVDFSISLTGYTFSTEVVSAITYACRDDDSLHGQPGVRSGKSLHVRNRDGGDSARLLPLAFDLDRPRNRQADGGFEGVLEVVR